MQKAVEDLELTIEKIKLGNVFIFYKAQYQHVTDGIGYVGGGERARQRHLSRNKMLPRDR